MELGRRAPIAALAGMALLATVATAAEPAIIARARAYVGEETALNALRAVRYTGTVVTLEAAPGAKPATVAIEIVFQRPAQQWLSARAGDMTELTVLDGFDGWKRIESTKDRAQWRQMALPIDAVRRMRATTWSNLAYWRGLDAQGGRVEEQGTKVVDGVTCEKIAFIHHPQIIYYRYFDPTTGRLVLTETETGETIREQGELRVNGIRFPRTVVTTAKNARGQPVTVTMTFDTIVTNEPLPAAHFQAPLQRPR